jgi:protein TonB
MFDTLLESKRAKQRNVGASLTSAVFHIGAIVGVVISTAKAAMPEAPPDEKVEFAHIEKPPEEPPPPVEEAPPVELKTDAPPPKGFQTLTAPIEIPTVIPQIDLTARVTNELDFTGEGVKGGIAAGVVKGKGEVTDQSYFVFEVEKQAKLAPGNPRPVYPKILEQTQQVGKVMVSFVIDTTGKADMSTLKILESSHPLFTEEVRKILPKYHYIPAEIGGRKVRMHVNQPFDFVLGGGGE